MMIIHHEKLPDFEIINTDKIKLLCKMCEVTLYKQGDQFNFNSGGIIFKGSVTKVKMGSEVGFGDKKKKGSSRNLHKSKTLDPEKLESQKKGSSKNLSFQLAADQKFLAKKQTIKDLGSMMK